MLVQVKQIGWVLQSFYYKGEKGWVCTGRGRAGGLVNMDEINKINGQRAHNTALMAKILAG